MISDLRVLPWQNTLLDNLTPVEACRKAGMVRRFHTHTYVIGQQSVAEHSFNMLCLLMNLHPSPSKYLLFAILTHDLGEGAVGDVPSPAKWASPSLRAALDESEAAAREKFLMDFEPDLGEVDRFWLRFCDYFEGAMFARDQIVLGNRGCQIVFELYMTTIKKLRQEWITLAQSTIGNSLWPEVLQSECVRLIQHYTSLTGEYFEWPE